MLSAQEVNYYNDLVDNGLAYRINCPFGEDDIIVTRVNSQDEVYFECLSCKSVFHPGIKVIKIIKDTIDKYKNQV